MLAMAAFSWKGTPQESKQIMLRAEEMGEAASERKSSKEAELREESGSHDTSRENTNHR